MSHKNRLLLREMGNDRLLAIDPDNCFWGIAPRRGDSNTIPEAIINLHRVLREELDKEMEDFRFSASLTAVYIDPTDRCNSNCPYCYIPEEKRKNGREMDWKLLELTLRRVEEHFKDKEKKPVVIFHAAEPMLLKALIFRGIQGFSDKFHFGIQTNGTLFNRFDVDFLLRHRVGIGISLDSFEPEINNKQRPEDGGNGNFERAVQAIEWFNGYKGLNVITTITRFNVTQLPDIVEFLHSKGVSCVLLNPVRLTQRSALRVKPDEGLMTEYFIKAVDRAIELSQTGGRRIVIGNFANIILGIVAPTARRLMCDISPCGGGRCFLTITADGEMLPCGEFTGFKGFSGGKIFDATISEAMESKAFRGIRARVVERIEECEICDFRNICGAPCPAEMHGIGNMYEKSIFCDFYKAIIEYAFKLIADGKVKYILRENYLKNLQYEYAVNPWTNTL